MGLMDRDYMKDAGRVRPFSPPPESTTTGWLVKLFIFACLLYLGFKFAYWLDHRSKPAPGKAVATASPTTTPAAKPAAQTPPQQPAARPTPPQTPSYRSLQDTPAQPGVITKCVINGKTSYGDDKCAAGAVTSTVVTKASQNLMAAVTVTPVAQVTAPEPAPATTAQPNPGVNYAALKAECNWLDARIKYLDDFARQPQSGQMQDWIRDQRKEARDRQFRIRCQ